MLFAVPLHCVRLVMLDPVSEQLECPQLRTLFVLSLLGWFSAEFCPSDRGAGYFFSEEPCKRFLLDNGFVAMIRAHEVVAKGVRVHFGCCWTVFSHPRYMGLRNVAATLVITDGMNFILSSNCLQIVVRLVCMVRREGVARLHALVHAVECLTMLWNSLHLVTVHDH
jgi:hypothetical protein